MVLTWLKTYHSQQNQWKNTSQRSLIKSIVYLEKTTSEEIETLISKIKQTTASDIINMIVDYMIDRKVELLSIFSKTLNLWIQNGSMFNNYQ